MLVCRYFNTSWDIFSIKRRAHLFIDQIDKTIMAPLNDITCLAFQDKILCN